MKEHILKKLSIPSVGYFMSVLTLLVIFSVRQTYASEKEIEKLLSLPEEKIDVGRAALIIAKDFYTNLDVNEYSSKIDAMVKKASIYAKGSKDPTYRIRAIITVFYKEGIKYDYSDPYLDNQSNKYLNGLIDTKKGACVTMPVLFLAIAQRLGYPVYAVKAPDHVFLKYVDPNYKESNIEITAGGGYAPDDEYIRQFQITQKAIISGEYLRPLKYRELLADMVAGAAIDWAQRGDLSRAIRYLERCVQVFPRSGGINDVLGRAYIKYAESIDGDDAKKIYDKGVFHLERAKELGFTRLPMDEYAKKLKALSKDSPKGNKGGKQ